MWIQRFFFVGKKGRMENILNKINEIEIKLQIAESENDKNRIERLENLLLQYNIEKNRINTGK